MKRGKLITNNPMFSDMERKNLSVDYRDIPAEEILTIVRDYVHKNFLILTHPLHSSLKPNETNYRTVVISEVAGHSVDLSSLELIEDAIMTYSKFSNKDQLRDRDEKILHDYQLIDYDLILKAME